MIDGKVLNNEDLDNVTYKNLLKVSSDCLEWVHIGGAGCEEYLYPEFVKSKITLTNGKIIQGPEVSDHAIALLLSISRNLNYVIEKNKTFIEYVNLFPNKIVNNFQVDQKLKSEIAIDPDCWIVEIEDKKGKNYFENI